MKFQAGDRVLLLHSNEEGEVVEIINDKMVMVDVDGVQFPVYTDQIDFPYFKRFSEQTAARKKAERAPHKTYIDNVKPEKTIGRYRVGNGAWLAFLPLYEKQVLEEDVIERFRIYLINQTADALQFDYHMYSGSETFNLVNQLASNADFYLHDMAFEALNDQPKFTFGFSLVQPDRNRATHFDCTLKIRARTLFKRIEEMHAKNEPTLSFQLFEHYPGREAEPPPASREAPGNLYDASRARQHLEPAKTVVDLHIEKLTDSWAHLSNFEILTWQLNAFEKYYHLAVAHRQPQLTVIHGIGTGRLKEEIHAFLKGKKEVGSFVNQYHPAFGYGATEIFFRY